MQMRNTPLPHCGLVLKLIHSLLMVIRYTFSNLCTLARYNKRFANSSPFAVVHRRGVTVNQYILTSENVAPLDFDLYIDLSTIEMRLDILALS